MGIQKAEFKVCRATVNNETSIENKFKAQKTNTNIEKSSKNVAKGSKKIKK